jgi:hypothetical protein
MNGSQTARISVFLTAMTMVSALPVQAATCGNQLSGTFNGKSVWKAGIAVGFKSAALAVDADGAPNSYQVDGKGLSFTCDGVTAIGSTPDSDPQHWQEKCRAGWAAARASGDYSNLRIFGFLTGARNVPLVQKDGDPLPNLGFISTTSASISDGPPNTQRHWVNAVQVPYVVLSPAFVSKFAVAPGDLVLVYRPRTDKTAFAVYGDGGKLGEASVKLHQDIGNDPLVTQGGVSRAKRGLSDTTLTVVFPGRATHPTVKTDTWLAEIQQVGAKALADWGGLDRVKACAN